MKIYRDVIFWDGIFYVVFVSFIMTIFELVFFSIIIFPNQTYQMIGYIKNIHKINSQGGDISSTLSIYREILSKLNYNSSLYEVLKEREDILINEINGDAISYISIEIFMLLFVLIFLFFTRKHVNNVHNIYYIINNNNSRSENNSNSYEFNRNDMSAVFISSFCTILFLIFFQISMYNYAKQFKYIGANGSEEIFNLINNKILANI